jgi:alpha-beta hydrolase superfamily lysophospholipase
MPMASSHPHWFGSSPSLFGHLHVPDDGVCRGPAVLLCGTFGYEEMSSHRSLRLLAEQLAAQGSVCLHFDQVGTGDSADLLRPHPAHVDRPLEGLSAWPMAIEQAVEHLKRVAGVAQVVVFGLRLGATMACLAAQHRADIQALIALAPVLRGKAYAREAKVLAQATLARTGMTPASATEAIEFGGYVLGVDDVNFLQGIDLTQVSKDLAPRVLLLDRDDMPSDEVWAESLRAGGSEVEQVRLPGYLAMMQVPHFSVPPQAILDHVAEWVRAMPAHAQGLPVSTSHLADTLRLPGQGVIERAQWLKGASPLSVVISKPATPPATHQPAVLMINTGGERRIGTNRMYARWSRAWAERGWSAMRLDLAGLGHSPARAGHAHEIHLRHAHEDIKVAIEHLRQVHGANQIHLVGLCSGAFHALNATFEGQALDSVTAINQMVYFWQSKMPLEGERSEAVTVAITEGVKKSLGDPQRWLKLLKGQVNVSVIGLAVLRRLRQMAALGTRALARELGWSLAHDLHTQLIQTSRRGIHMHLVFAAGEAGLTMVQSHAPKAIKRLQGSGHLQLSVIRNADHTFTQSDAQHRLFQVVDASLQSRATRSHAANPSSKDLTALCSTS